MTISALAVSLLEVSEAVAFLFLAFLSFVAEDAVTPRQRISNNGVQHRCRIRRVIELHFMDSISRRRSSAHVRLAPFKLEGDPDNSSGHLYTWGLTTGEESGQNNQADNIPARHKLISLAFARLLTVADTITIASNSVKYKSRRSCSQGYLPWPGLFGTRSLSFASPRSLDGGKFPIP